MPNSIQTGNFSCAPFIKEIGRGKDGARGLPLDQAKTLFSAILRGEVSDFELGAVLIALRVKGESHDELIGFLQAIAEHWPDESHSRRSDCANVTRSATCSPSGSMTRRCCPRRNANAVPVCGARR